MLRSAGPTSTVLFCSEKVSGQRETPKHSLKDLKDNAIASVLVSHGGLRRVGMGGSLHALLQRYYRNNMTDHSKQNAIDVFLGNFIPGGTRPNIWCVV